MTSSFNSKQVHAPARAEKTERISDFQLQRQEREDEWLETFGMEIVVSFDDTGRQIYWISGELAGMTMGIRRKDPNTIYTLEEFEKMAVDTGVQMAIGRGELLRLLATREEMRRLMREKKEKEVGVANQPVRSSCLRESEVETKC